MRSLHSGTSSGTETETNPSKGRVFFENNRIIWCCERGLNSAFLASVFCIYSFISPDSQGLYTTAVPTFGLDLGGTSARRWVTTKARHAGHPRKTIAEIVGHAADKKDVTFGVYATGASEVQRRACVGDVKLPPAVGLAEAR